MGDVRALSPIYYAGWHTTSGALVGQGSLIVGTAAHGAGVAWNPSDKGTTITLSNGNLDATSSSGNAAVRSTTSHSTGQYYFEGVLTTWVSSANSPRFGIVHSSVAIATVAGSPGPFGPNGDLGVYQNSPNNGYHVYSALGGGSQANVATTIAQGDVYGIAIDFSAGKIWFHRNGTYQSGDPSTATSPSFTGVSGTYCIFTIIGTSSQLVTGRFTRSAMGFTVPTGYLAWDGT